MTVQFGWLPSAGSCLGPAAAIQQSAIFHFLPTAIEANLEGNRLKFVITWA